MAESQQILERATASPTLNQRRWLGPLLVLTAAAWLVAFALYTADFFVDDAFIGFRYAENFLAGEGLVFNPGQRVEGITNIGWLIALLPMAFLVGPLHAAKILGFDRKTLYRKLDEYARVDRERAEAGE